MKGEVWSCHHHFKSLKLVLLWLLSGRLGFCGLSLSFCALNRARANFDIKLLHGHLCLELIQFIKKFIFVLYLAGIDEELLFFLHLCALVIELFLDVLQLINVKLFVKLLSCLRGVTQYIENGGVLNRSYLWINQYIYWKESLSGNVRNGGIAQILNLLSIIKRCCSKSVI